MENGKKPEISIKQPEIWKLVQFKLDKTRIDKINALKDKWNLNTRPKVLRVALDKVFASENI